MGVAGYRDDVAGEVCGVPGEALCGRSWLSPVLEDVVDVGGPEEGGEDEGEVCEEEEGSMLSFVLAKTLRDKRGKQWGGKGPDVQDCQPRNATKDTVIKPRPLLIPLYPRSIQFHQLGITLDLFHLEFPPCSYRHYPPPTTSFCTPPSKAILVVEGIEWFAKGFGSAG